ncbi:hypothetical protein EVAR_72561_1 [Eumeta japonica]|uniref:Uncharacterized protein n=1 Tax=Eumeta variegata TaxID=151549 RepID=A0A4C1T651_EUMVA|nr:hypothetical protein EVAR_72561_1 [Eumeta japonica]
MQELEIQHNAPQEELKRRREECIQLKSVLQQQTQSLKSLGNDSLSLRSSDQSFIQDNELNEAYQAQKLVNKQLEVKPKALTEENNAHFAELSRQQRNCVKKHAITERSDKLTLKLQQQGIADGHSSSAKSDTNATTNQNTKVAVGKQKAKSYQEYRRVILEIIINLYEALVIQIEGHLEGNIVEAILDNDEIQRRHQKTTSSGRANRQHL